jgi:hypothetical protein
MCVAIRQSSGPSGTHENRLGEWANRSQPYTRSHPAAAAPCLHIIFLQQQCCACMHVHVVGSQEGPEPRRLATPGKRNQVPGCQRYNGRHTSGRRGSRVSPRGGDWLGGLYNAACACGQSWHSRGVRPQTSFAALAGRWFLAAAEDWVAATTRQRHTY